MEMLELQDKMAKLQMFSSLLLKGVDIWARHARTLIVFQVNYRKGQFFVYVAGEIIEICETQEDVIQYFENQR